MKKSFFKSLFVVTSLLAAFAFMSCDLITGGTDTTGGSTPDTPAAVTFSDYIGYKFTSTDEVFTSYDIYVISEDYYTIKMLDGYGNDFTPTYKAFDENNKFLVMGTPCDITMEADKFSFPYENNGQSSTITYTKSGDKVSVPVSSILNKTYTEGEGQNSFSLKFTDATHVTIAGEELTYTINSTGNEITISGSASMNGTYPCLIANDFIIIDTNYDTGSGFYMTYYFKLNQ